MRQWVKFGTMAFVVVVSAATAFAGSVTVGRFYTELAQAKRLQAADAATAETSLRAAGYQLPEVALDKNLTEGDMTAIANAMGLSVSTSRPSQAIGETQLDTFMKSFGSQIGAPAVGGGNSLQGRPANDPGNSGNGKGLKKGHNKSTSEPS
jgi:hypothetical protein